MATIGSGTGLLNATAVRFQEHAAEALKLTSGSLQSPAFL